MKAIIISGLLYGLSDNIIPFLDKETDVYCHTWNKDWNGRWMIKLNRYKKYCNNLVIDFEKPKFDKKLHSYFYSTWKAVNLIDNIDQYDKIIKFKPNIQTEDIGYVGNIEYYFSKAKIQSRPLLEDTVKEECFYGPIYYKVMDERMFSGYPLGFKKCFHILYDKFIKEVEILDKKLISKYGPDYEGSIFWANWINSHGVELIQDLDLKLANNIQHNYE